jgi:hypothetical protein
MPLENFSLLSSIWGASAVIMHVEFQELRQGKGSAWQALIVARDGQMYFSNVKGEPRQWASLDRAFQELSGAVPPLAEMKIIRAAQRYRRSKHASS